MNFIRTARPVSLHDHERCISYRLLRIKFRQKSLNRMMASMSQRGDHATITATQPRQKVMANATVTTIRNISPSVKMLVLKVDNTDFVFKPGQWVDFFLPNTDTLSGYSICSSPRQLKTEGTIELAVKISEHPVAAWVHQKCEEGVVVRVESGGDFFYDPDVNIGELERDVLLLAGGVGINPLVSIFRHLADLHLDNELNGNLRNESRFGNVWLLYSARSDDELLFKDQILNICSLLENMRARFFVTKETHLADGITEASGRIDAAVIDEAISTFRSKSRISFICGPPQMLSDMEILLKAADFRPDQIRFEKWW